MDQFVDTYIREIVEVASIDLGNSLDVSSTRWLRSPNEELLPEDSDLVFQIDGVRGHDDVVLLVSSVGFPNTVGEALEKAAQVGMQVDVEVGAHISTPLYQGSYGARTYAVFKKIDHVSENRFVRLVEKSILTPAIVSWCQSLSSQTANFHHEGSSYQTYFEDPLRVLINDEKPPKRIRDFAARRLDDLTGQKGEMFTVVEHGDLWIGNVLFDRPNQWNVFASGQNFSVIDWGGALTDGYPCMDVIRFLMSTQKSVSGRSIALLDKYQETLGISNYDCSTYAMLSIGRLVQNFEYMPPSRFVSLCETTFKFLLDSGRIEEP